MNRGQAKGTAITFANSISFLGASIAQSVIGILLDFFWDGSQKNGIPFYSHENYAFAFSLFPIAVLAAWVCALLLREKRQRKQRRR